MDDSQLSRYSRQILLPEIDLAGQERLMASKVMIVGMGGLGASVAQTLAAAGVGHLDIWDFDKVELSNLQRQPLYDTEQVGMPKVIAASERLKAINPEITITTNETRFTHDLARQKAKSVAVILDCTDNYKTRCEVNRLAVALKVPLIAGSAIRFEGQLMTFLNQDGPCYECIQATSPIRDVACRDVGVLASQVILIATMQAQTCLNYVLGIGELINGQMVIHDGIANLQQKIEITIRHDCPVCQQHSPA